jgi:hypothetical protein
MDDIQSGDKRALDRFAGVELPVMIGNGFTAAGMAQRWPGSSALDLPRDQELAHGRGQGAGLLENGAVILAFEGEVPAAMD